MIGLFKPQRVGKVLSYSNQYIETSFLLFLIPLQSYFINLNSKQTYEIPLNKISLQNYYISFGLVASGILFFVSMITFGLTLSENDTTAYWGYIPTLASGSLILAGFLYNFTFGNSNRYEKKKRTIFQNVVALNALPEWLSTDTARSIYEQHRINLPTDWKVNVRNNRLTTEEFFYYYTMLSYEQRITPTPENTQLLNTLESRFSK